MVNSPHTTNAKATVEYHSLMYLNPSLLWRGVPFIGHPFVSRGKCICVICVQGGLLFPISSG